MELTGFLWAPRGLSDRRGWADADRRAASIRLVCREALRLLVINVSVFIAYDFKLSETFCTFRSLYFELFFCLALLSVKCVVKAQRTVIKLLILSFRDLF